MVPVLKLLFFFDLLTCSMINVGSKLSVESSMYWRSTQVFSGSITLLTSVNSSSSYSLMMYTRINISVIRLLLCGNHPCSIITFFCACHPSKKMLSPIVYNPHYIVRLNGKLIKYVLLLSSTIFCNWRHIKAAALFYQIFYLPESCIVGNSNTNRPKIQRVTNIF